MNHAIIVDVDGTLADVAHRRHHVRGGNRDWGAFFGAMADDPPVIPVITLVRCMSDAGYKIILCSGRPEQYRSVTESWLVQYQVPYDALFMRPDDDTRPDHIVKREMLAQIRRDEIDIAFAVDDRPSVVAAWRAEGLTCFACAGWDEEPHDRVPGALTLMVGPSGAGKSTWLRSPEAAAMGIHESHIVSSDQIRADLCGDFRDQTKNEAVFTALHAVVRARLEQGLPAVIDATNLKRRDRINAAALGSGKVRYVVIDRPMAEKERDAGWRAEIKDAEGKPVNLLAKHEQTFRSQVKDIISGDGRTDIEVLDLRR